jgi:dienelactone hydrolase
MSKSMTECGQVLNSFLGLRQTFGKPQKLSIVGNHVYWLEGTSQELFSANLTTLSVAKVISPPLSTKKMSKEEELLRERQRTHATGISSYKVREDDGAVFFQTGCDMSIYYPLTGDTVRVFEDVTGDPLSSSPKLCIQHIEDLPLTEIAFVQDGNIFRGSIIEATSAGVSDTSDDGSHETTTTSTTISAIQPEKMQASTPSHLSVSINIRRVTNVGEENFECGTADYIMQEEFSRFTGHWNFSNRTLFTQTDTTVLKTVTLVGANNELEQMSFPKVGDPNAISTVAVYEEKQQGGGVFRVLPMCALRRIAPWVEYIPRLGFIDQDNFFLMLLDRRQERGLILSVHIPLLPVVAESEIVHTSAIHSADGACDPTALTVVWQQTVPWAWVEVTDALCLRPNRQLMGAHDEKSHFFHLYERDMSLASGQPVWKPVTQGNFNVGAKYSLVDPNHITFVANMADPLGSELYFLNLNTGVRKRLSPLGSHVHSYTVALVGTEYVAVMVLSTLQDPPSLKVGSFDASTIASSDADELALQMQTIATSWCFSKLVGEAVLNCTVAPQVHHLTNRRGAPMAAAVFIPQAPPRPLASMPLVMICYGGPHVQLVHANSFDLRTNPLVQSLCSLGIAVAVCDNQMSNANSLAHHAVCKKNMGHFETSDNIDTVRALCSLYSELDPRRVGICGWSYGGYSVLLALSQAPDVFKLGFSGAPVGDWRLYDPGYTERYMGLLEEAAATYESSTIAASAQGFPDEINRVFIAHGLLDENVHFAHTCAVLDAMVEHGKPYSLLVYPGERHGLRQKPKSRLHYDSQLLKTVSELL